MVVGVGATAPFAGVALAGTAPLLPAYAAAILLLDLFAVTLLVSQHVAFGARAILALAAAYLFNGLTVVAWAASFPDVFAPEGLLGGDLQTTAVIAAFRRLAFPIGLVAYALLRRRGGGSTTWRPWSPTLTVMVLASTVMAALLAAVVAVALSGAVPALMADARVPTAAWDVILWTSLAATLAAAATIARLRTLCALDLWLLVALAAFLVEILMLGFVADGVRFSVGWWAGRGFGLAAVAAVALALFVETVGATARSVATLAAELEARRAREASLEALGAAIAHELNQPLAAIATSAEAAGRWLNRPEPELGRARERLAAIAEESARAGRVLAGLRRSFGRRAPRDGTVEARRLLLSVAALARDRAEAMGARIELDDRGLGDVVLRGDVDQLRQALLNIVINAIEAMTQAGSEPRVATLSARVDGAALTVTVEDTGPGVPEALTEAAFEAFRSDKPHGMGLGLMISRTIVETHGGVIAATNARNGGAVFTVRLPMEHAHG